jgi:predicted amidohydrolase
MRIAAAAYPLDPIEHFDAYAAKMAHWVEQAEADLLVFPEYGRMELAALDGAEAAGDLERSLQSAARHSPAADGLMADLARKHGCHILAPSGPVFDGGSRPVNRATLFGPEGLIGHQDKQVMTRFERETWNVVPGGPLRIFETSLGKIGILICYDAEFPLLGRALAEAGAEILLIPSCTDALAGYSRVRIGAMARALENQCVTVQSPTVGGAAWSPAVDQNVGAAGVFGPPDLGFPSTGVIAEGAVNEPGWIRAEIDLATIARVRAEGAVFNHAHWPESVACAHVPPRRSDLP